MLQDKNDFGRILYYGIQTNRILIEINIERERGKCKETMSKIDIFEAAKFLVALHYQANKTYTCNRTKIEKLLAIADLISIKEDCRLFAEHPIYINGCGIGYRVLAKDTMHFPMDNIIEGVNQDLTVFSQTDPLVEVDESIRVPDLYTYQIADVSAKKILKDVFCRFGAYTAKLIGTEIDGFKNQINITLEGFSNVVNISVVKSFFLQNKFENNYIAKYIANYKGEV